MALFGNGRAVGTHKKPLRSITAEVSFRLTSPSSLFRRDDAAAAVAASSADVSLFLHFYYLTRGVTKQTFWLGTTGSSLPNWIKTLIILNANSFYGALLMTPVLSQLFQVYSRYNQVSDGKRMKGPYWAPSVRLWCGC
jgi:hypothetical protein